MARQQSVTPRDRPCQKSDNLLEKPIHRFFKIILQSTIEDKKLRLPLKFVKRYGQELSDVAKFTVSKDKVWQVRLTKGRKNIWFDHGWHEFAKFYSVCHGHFLVFKYKGKSSFSVHIFDRTACEIPYPSIEIRNDEKEPPHHLDGNADDDCFEISGSDAYRFTASKTKSKYCSSQQNLPKVSSGSNPPEINKRQKNSASTDNKNFEQEYRRKGKKCKVAEMETDGNGSPTCENEREIIVGGNFYCLFSRLSPESKRAVMTARTYKPKNPAFMCVMQQQNLHSMYVPSAFSKKYLQSISRDKIRIRISDGKHWQREWFVRPFWRDPGGLLLTEGWAAFSKDNGFSSGDVCVFEMINSKTVVLKASIFYACLE